MSAERDAGLAAMQSGDIETAVQQLELAAQQTPNDYQTSMYLGAAYGQAKRHTDAVTILTTAVQIEPANAQARYNLGIAMEQGGWIEQAKQAYEQALTLQPDYAKAQEALGRTQAMLTPQQPTVDPMNMPTTALSPQGYAPNLEKQTQPPVYAPPAEQGYGQQQPQPGYYGAPPPSPYGTPPPAPYAQQVAMYPAHSQYYEDSFSIKDAFRDWKEVIMSPRTFWQRQANSDGLSAPIAMNLTMLGTLLLVVLVMSMLFIGLRAPATIPFILIIFVVYAIFGSLGIILGNMIGGGILFLVSKIFGSSGTFAGAYRSVSYSYAPYVLYLTLGLGILIPVGGSTVVSLINDTTQQIEQSTNAPRSGATNNPFGSPGTPGTPGQPPFGSGTSAPFSGSSSGISNPMAAMFASIAIVAVLFYIGLFGVMIWVLVLIGMGIAHTQKISTGGAVGTIVLGIILPYILMTVAYLSLFGMSTMVGGTP